MLDYDYLCDRWPSISAIMSGDKEWRNYKFFYGDQEILIPRIHSWDQVSLFPDASILINLASFRSATSVNKQAIDCKKFDAIFTIAEWIPERETRTLLAYAKEITWHRTRLFWPAIVGGLIAGVIRIGNTWGSIKNIIKARLHQPWSIGIVSKSGGMMNELMHIAARYGDGTQIALQIWWDRYPMTTFADIIQLYQDNDQVKTILMLGEVGNENENEIADMLRDWKISKPVVARCCGTSAEDINTEIQFWHAGAKANIDSETAQFKNNNLRNAGALVPESFAQLWELLSSLYPQKIDLVASPMIVSKLKNIENRQHTLFSSSISDERWEELTYNKIPVSQFVESKSIAKVIGHLWFQKELPNRACDFITTTLILLADHGPAVAWALSTKITARAGKDLVTSVISWLNTIWPKFGWAITDAAKFFWQAKCLWQSPDEFVASMKIKGIIIPWIWHKIKNIHNPDQRCELLRQYRDNAPYTKTLKFALDIESITTQKKANLILNVDWHIAAMLIDTMIALDMSDEEIADYINADLCNGLFVAARTIWFIGHYLDEKRLQEGLFRMPEQHILYI
jgi:ATP-citrate lyase alpha-subunit